MTRHTDDAHERTEAAPEPATRPYNIRLTMKQRQDIEDAIILKIAMTDDRLHQAAALAHVCREWRLARLAEMRGSKP